MLLSVLAAAVAFNAPADDQRVTGASLFKNGFAFISREIPIRGAGEITIGELPQASLGTYWIAASKGLEISQVVRTTVAGKGERDLTTLEELLDANVGHVLTVNVRLNSEATYSGKLLSSSGQLLVMQVDKGTMAFPKSAVISVSSPTGEMLYKASYQTSHDVLKVTVKSTGPGTIYTYGLERGMTWTPAYAVDISDPKTLSITAKSTVSDDLTDLKDVEVRFVTGFPNIPWADVIEPLLTPQAATQLGGGFGGGGAGGFARREAGQMQNAASAPAQDFQAAFTPNSEGGIQAEDLFFYRQPQVTLKKGDRAYYILFQAKSEYSHLYTLDMGDTVVNNYEYRPVQQGLLDVWHALKFKNSSGQPLTTAAATVFKNNEIVGQDTLTYTSPGAELLLKISKALDIHAEQSEEEVSRVRATLNLPSGMYDLVTLKGTVQIQNSKPEAANMKVTKDLTGEVISTTGDPKTSKLTKGLIQLNPQAHLVWTPTVEGRKSLTLTYTYKLYVHE